MKRKFLPIGLGIFLAAPFLARDTPLAYPLRTFLFGTDPETASYWLIALLGVCLIMLCARWGKSNRRIIPLLMVAGIWMISILGSIVFKFGTEYANSLAAILVAFLTGLICVLIARRARWAILPLLGAAFVESCYAIWHMKASGGIAANNTYEQSALLGSVNTAVLGVTILPLIISALLHVRNETMRFVYMIAGAGIASALLLTQYDVGLIALAIAILVVLGRAPKTRAAAVMISSAVLCGTGIIYLYRDHTIGNFLATETFITKRYMAIWEAGGNAFRNHWIVGMGSGSLGFPAAIPVPGGAQVMRLSEPKNLVLHWLCTMGIGGGILLLGLVHTVSNTLRQSKGKFSCVDPLTSGVAASWLGLAIVGLMETPFGTPERYSGNFMFGALLGLSMILRIESSFLEEPGAEHESTLTTSQHIEAVKD